MPAGTLPRGGMVDLAAEWSELLHAEAAGYAEVAIANLKREFPSDVRHTMADPAASRCGPRVRTPVFYGSLDWHSAVEMHWLLMRLLRIAGDDMPTAKVRKTLRAQLSPVALAVEADYIAGPGRTGERPYGWGWALALVHEAWLWDDPEGARWVAAMAPLADAITGCFLEWLPKATSPVRCGVHSNSAFGLSRALGYARLRAAAGDPALLEAIAEKAFDWFASDSFYPGGWEPSGHDFLSPGLTEAELMAQILPQEEFADWLSFFLPGIAGGEPAS